MKIGSSPVKKIARSLKKSVKVGEAVPRNAYKAVAEVLAFVYKLKNKNKAVSTGMKKPTVRL